MNRPRNFDEVVSKIPGAKQGADKSRGGWWLAPCPLPGHKHPGGHFSVRDAGNRAVVKCFGGVHDNRAIR